MAKRRIISQDIIVDKTLNSLSVAAQYLFVRFLAISDDCGIIPGDIYELKVLTNPHPKLCFNKALDEIIENRLLLPLIFNGKNYYCFKKERFEEYQSYVIKNRRRSEYLRITIAEYELLYRDLDNNQTFPGTSGKFPEVAIGFEKNKSYPIESLNRKIIIESNNREEEPEKEFAFSDYQGAGIYWTKLPLKFQTNIEFLKAWYNWKHYSEESGLAFTPRIAEAQIKFLEAAEKPIEIINKAIINRWNGLNYGSKDKRDDKNFRDYKSGIAQSSGVNPEDGFTKL